MSQPLRVLLVEDVEADALLVLRALRTGGFAPEYKRADTPEAMTAALGGGPWDIVISDYTMPGFSGLDALALFQQSGLDAPFIIVTGTIGEEDAVRCLHAGAADYLLKDRLERLPSAVQRALAAAEEHRRRLKAEETARLLQRHSEVLIATVDGIVWEADATTFAFTFVSAQAERLLGYPVRQWLESPTFWADHIHPDDREWVVKLCATRTAEKRSHASDYRMLAADGRVVWLHDAVAVVVEDGRPAKLRGIMVDITERKLVTEALHASEERFRELFEHSPDAIFVESLEGIVLDANAAACRLHCMAHGQLVGRYVPDLVPATERESVARSFAKLATGELTKVEAFIWTADGNAVPVEITSNRIVFSGQPAVLLHVRDITERKRAGAAMQASKRMLRLVLDTIPQGVFWKDRESRYLGCNAVVTRHRGVENAAALMGKTDREFGQLTPEQAESFIRNDREVMASGQPQLGTIEQTTRADGSARWLETSKVPLHDAEGNVIGVLGTWQDITERKQTEEAAQTSKRMLQLVLDNIPQGVFWKDCESRYLGCNARVAQAFGIGTPDAIAGMTDRDFAALTPEQGEFFVKKDREVMASGQPQLGIIEQATMADGSTRWLETNKMPLFDTAGNVMGILGTWQDITGRKQAEEKLRLTQFSVDRAVDAVFWIAPDAEILYVNDAACRTLGYSREELIGNTVPGIDPNFPAAAWPAHWAEVKQRGSFTFESDHRKKDGTAIRIELTVNYLEFEGREYNCAIMRDITVRKHGEEALEMMRLSVDRAGDSIFWVSRAGHILYVNDAACAGRGYTREELLGMNIFDLDPDYQPGVWGSHFEDLKRRGTITLETRHRAKDGRIFPVEVNANYVFINGQEFNFATLRDLTERRKQERLALRSQRMQSIGTLAGGIAHDLNNALAPIMMSSEVLRLEYPRESPMLDSIETSAKRAADMVKQLLTFAKGAEGERAAVHPERLLSEMENLVKASFPKNIRLAIQSAPRLPAAQGDATQLHQVLLNLCVNARDAMPSGGTLTLEALHIEMDAAQAGSVPDARPGRYVALRVSDTGTGIPPDILDRIFDPFFTTKGPDKGTGLGLSTVMGIVRGHGGFTQVTSQPGQGSTFTVCLPVGPEGSEPAPTPKAAGKFRGNGETILFVEDEAGVRFAARTVLQLLNFKPLIATDGADGLMQAAQHRTEIRAIITDLHMPRMDGLEFVREVRRLLPGIPIMVASGRLEEAEAGELATLGVTGRLDKPFTQAQLADALKNLLAQ